MDTSLQALRAAVEQESWRFKQLQDEIGKVIVGQSRVVERILVGLLADGHLLLEGLPGLAKTLTFKTLASALTARFSRIQFTPDLLPADVVGTTIYHPHSGQFSVKQGPIFANLVLADEINRAPAKVQSALLEAMQERQVTLGDQTFQLPQPFLVLATQNPIEQEGTYALPEAQVDRFMLKIRIEYPTREEESQIIDRMAVSQPPEVQAVLEPGDLMRARQLVTSIYLDERVKGYILDIVFTTRYPERHGLDALRPLLGCGASPRASICLAQAARAHAFLQGRAYVIPDDVKALGLDVLRHRIVPTYEAEARELGPDALLRSIFDHVKVP